MPSSHKKTHGLFAVTVAIIWNFIIMILKFIWFFLSGSGVLFSEAIHSVADTSNQVLLMVGLKKSRKKADANFSYWYWKERFFRAILSACGIFFIWAGVTVYHSIENFLHPIIIENSFYVLIILAISFIVESITLLIAIISVYDRQDWLLESIKEADNASKAVILEDSVAVFWVLIAFVSILLTNLTGKTYFDSIWSLIIWILLWIVAIILIMENKSYLLGRGIDEELKEDIIETIKTDNLIEKIIDFKSEVIDIDCYIIKVEAEFNGSSLMREINHNWFFQDEYEYIKEDYNEFLKFCVDYADRIPRIIGKRIDALEKNIKEKHPEIKHIDIELN
ncbi:MAG: Cation efflux protein [uncultured bacterium (gcode 4)]|uniref:Cation efflux protein n=1 Tax=uncultured bacterium (gcode 4) TaxID=1234023 RepID=K2BUG0_9BACT|nr:MAG: Cation efflux protein [uncultured bacterium (gcode 4)]